jgi:hypothetical protein
VQLKRIIMFFISAQKTSAGSQFGCTRKELGLGEKSTGDWQPQPCPAHLRRRSAVYDLEVKEF